MLEQERARRAIDPEATRGRNRAKYAAHREKINERARIKRVKLPREIEIENHLRDQITTLDGLCMKFIDPGQKGAPDRLVVLAGRPTFYVELKRPRLGRLSDAQKRYHRRLRDRGQRVWTLWSKDEVDAFIIEVMLT